MESFKTSNFRRQIVLGYAISVALVVFFCGWATLSMSGVRELSQELVLSSSQNTLVWDRMVNSLERQDRCMLRLLVEADQDATKIFAENAMEFEAALANARKDLLAEEGRPALDRIASDYGQFVDAFVQLHELYQDESLAGAVAHYNTIMQPLFLSIREELLRLRGLFQERVNQHSLEVQRESRWAETSMIISAVFFAFLGGVLLNVLSRQLNIFEQKRAQAFEMERRAKLAAENAMVAKNRFLATVTHELRTPLTGILGNLDFLEEARDRTPKEKEFLMGIRSSSQILLHLVNDLLDLARVEDGLNLQSRAFPLSEVVDELEAVLTPAASAKDLTLETTIIGLAPARLEGDPDRLRQILMNLMGNAIKFTEEGKVSLTLEVEALSPSRWQVRFEVKDEGIGIPEDEQDKVFQPFHQVTGPQAKGGAGLGLAIVRSLVERMGGEIELESTVGKGSRFFFTLEFDEGEEPKESGPAELPDLGPARVLLAEDNPISSRVISLQLRKLGLEVLTAADGEEVLEKLAEEPVDLILMDCQMPKLDGYATSRRIRADEKRHQPTILALTAHAVEGEFEKCLEAGMDDFLTKPVDIHALARTLRSWLQKSGKEKPAEPVTQAAEDGDKKA